MNVLVTGGAGYIGTHTCVELMEAGHEVSVVDNFSNSNPEALKRVSEIAGKKFPIHQVDLLDANAVDDVFSQGSFDAVIHFAGHKAVGESVQKPLEYYMNNVTGTLVLCQAMQKYGVHRLVFSSSATVYGTAEEMPLTEDLPIAAINPYGRTKVMIEQILTDLASSAKEFSIALLRYFNPVGAHKSGRIGEDPSGVPNNLTPYISKVAVGVLPELPVFGNDYDTPDGTCVRDYIHVMDLANGHVKALEKIASKTGVNAYNLGTGVGYSVMDVIHAFEQASGVKIPYRVTDRRPGDAPVSFADATKAQDELGWKAKRTLLEMCEDLWRWQSNNPNGYQSQP